MPLNFIKINPCLEWRMKFELNPKTAKPRDNEKKTCAIFKLKIWIKNIHHLVKVNNSRLMIFLKNMEIPIKILIVVN